jgi:hypothetical protein
MLIGFFILVLLIWCTDDSPMETDYYKYDEDLKKELNDE